MSSKGSPLSRGGPAPSGPHQVELQQGLLNTHRRSSKKLYPRPVQGAWRAESRGSLRGDLHNLWLLCATAFPARGQRNHGHKGAILNGISGQGTQVHRLRCGV